LSNLHRLTWIDRQIRAEKHPNCKTIAGQFEISTRQASRDIEYLRDTMGAPVIYSAKHNGYCYSEPTYVLPAGIITDEEKKTLSYLAYQYQNAGSGRATRLAELFQRLAGEDWSEQGSAGELAIFGVKPEEILSFDLLRRAIAGRKKVQLTYNNLQGKTTWRTVAPYKLYIRSHRNYLVGYCELRDEIRVFRVDRIYRIELTSIPFTVVPWFDPAQYSDSQPFELREPYIAVIRFEKSLPEECLRFPLNPVEDRTYRVEFFESAWLLRELLALPFGFVITAPNWLKEKLRRKLDRIYRDHC
jgi:predicted DNA-binding transcriptional regulator YafY